MILDWSARDNEGVLHENHIHDKEGNIVPATLELITQTLRDLPELFSWIRTQAANTALFLKDVSESDLKN